MSLILRILLISGIFAVGETVFSVAGGYQLPDTGIHKCYEAGKEILCPSPAEPFYCQDAQYQGHEPAYQNNGDGTLRISVIPPAKAPSGLKADPYISGEAEYTRLTWNATNEESVTGYNIYSVAGEELYPYFARIATTAAGTTSYDSNDYWENWEYGCKTYAVTAVKSDGSESFFLGLAQNNDRDHDGLTDEEEASSGTDPTNPDTDDDGLKDDEEDAYGTDPLVTDTDGDGYSDWEEIQAESDPLDENSVPTLH